MFFKFHRKFFVHVAFSFEKLVQMCGLHAYLLGKILLFDAACL